MPRRYSRSIRLGCPLPPPPHQAAGGVRVHVEGREAGQRVDLLVEFEAGHKPGLLALSEIEAEFSVLLGGRKADLRTRQDLSRYFREEVERTAEVQYAA